LGMYHQYLTDPENTLKRYKAFLSAWYTRSLPDTYALAGLRFDFSRETIEKLAQFALWQINSV
jgi:oligoendopeptidase F